MKLVEHEEDPQVKVEVTMMKDRAVVMEQADAVKDKARRNVSARSKYQNNSKQQRENTDRAPSNRF